MRALWHALHTELTRSTATLTFQTRFATLRRSSAELGRFPDPAALFDRLHAPGDDPQARNAVLAALVVAAQRQDATAQVAVTLLLLALWPGLDAVHRRLSRHFRTEPEALAAEITERTTRGIHGLDRSRVSWIAATLVRNTERDIRRGLAAGWNEARRRDPLPAAYAPPPLPPSPLGLPPGLDAEAAVPLLAGRLRPWIGADAGLVVAVAVQGDRQHEAAARLGLAPEAARKRYQRALRRLRLELDEFA